MQLYADNINFVQKCMCTSTLLFTFLMAARFLPFANQLDLQQVPGHDNDYGSKIMKYESLRKNIETLIK